MQELIDLLLANPLILIFIGIAILQGLGSLGAKAARRAIEQQRRAQRQAQQQQQADPLRPTSAAPQEPTVPSAAPARQPQPKPQPQPRPATRRVPDPDEVAAEIRRMMGLEEAPRAPEPVVRVEEPPPQRIIIREVEDEPITAPVVSERRDEPTIQVERVAVPMAVRRRTKRLLDVSDPAAALVAMEVFGQPRSLRGYDKL